MTNTPIASNALPTAGKNLPTGPTADVAESGLPFAELLGQQLELGQQLTLAQSTTLAAASANELSSSGIADTKALAQDTIAGIDPAAITPNAADASAAVASMLAQLNPNTNKAALSANMVEKMPTGSAAFPAPTTSDNTTGQAAATPLAATDGTPALSPSALVNPAQQTGSTTESSPLAGNTANNAKQQNFAATLANAQTNIAPEATTNIAMESVSALAAAQPSTGNNSAAMTQVLSSMASGLPQQPAQAAVTTPLNDARWPADFSQKVTWLSTTQNQVAELSLNPPDLGPLNVVLKITDNQATALFTSPHGSVREAVENAMPKLREMLADSGITLGNATVSDQAPRERDMSGFSGNREQTDRQRGETERHTDNSPPAATSAARPSRHNGMIDTFA